MKHLHGFAQKGLHRGIRTGSGSDRVATEQKNAIGDGATLGFFFTALTRSLPLPVLISLRGLVYLLFVQSSLTLSIYLAPYHYLSGLAILASRRLGGKMT